MSLKMLREHLCEDQARWQREWPDNVRWQVAAMIYTIDEHRPLGPDGKHGDRHTATCGCEDRGD